MKINNVNFFDDVKTYEDYYFNTVITDIPYNLGTKWFIDKDGTYQVKGKGGDFMNKWDGLNGETLNEFFKESFRVMKYGGYLLLFGMDRQLGPLHYYATKNGFEINQSLYWYFVSNFPKATDAGKMIDKRLKKERKVIGNKISPYTPTGIKDNIFDGGGYKIKTDENGKMVQDITEPSSNLAKIFDGYKYSKAPLKQMVETICVFSKPTKNKSVLDDIIEWGEDVDLLNYCPKVGKKERNIGIDTKNGEVSNHPTLKPINLIYEIAKLFKLPDIVDQKIYIPFSGSGSEVMGVIKAGYKLDNIYGCELNEEYYNIGQKRIKYFNEQNIT